MAVFLLSLWRIFTRFECEISLEEILSDFPFLPFARPSNFRWRSRKDRGHFDPSVSLHLFTFTPPIVACPPFLFFTPSDAPSGKIHEKLQCAQYVLRAASSRSDTVRLTQFNSLIHISFRDSRQPAPCHCFFFDCLSDSEKERERERKKRCNLYLRLLRNANPRARFSAPWQFLSRIKNLSVTFARRMNFLIDLQHARACKSTEEGKGEKLGRLERARRLFAPSGRVEESSPPGGSGEREVRWTREETVRETSRIVREYEEEEKRVGQDGEKEET